MDVGQDLVDPDDDLLAEHRREGRQPEVARPVVVLDRDPAVLRVPALDDVEVRHDLEPADHRRGHRRLDEQDVLELAVDPVADPQAVLLGIEMDVGGLAVAGAFQDLVDQLGQGRGDGLLLELLADVAMMLGAIGRERARRRRAATAVAGEPVWPLSPASAREPLERELIEELGRDQVQLEDRLAQVAVVLLAVELRRPNLLGRRAALS